MVYLFFKKCSDAKFGKCNPAVVILQEESGNNHQYDKTIEK